MGCATPIASCPGAAPGTYYDVVVEEGYSQSFTASETHRSTITNTATIGASAKLKLKLGKAGIEGSDALSFSSEIEKSWKQTTEVEKKKTVETHLECTKELHLYSGQTQVTLKDGST